MKRAWPIAYAVITAVLLFVWFHRGNELGGGEIGIPFHDLAWVVQILTHAWWPASLGNGYANVYGAMSLAFLVPFSMLGGPALANAALFGAVLFATMMGVRELASQLGATPAAAGIAGIVAALNPIMMTGVWHRFILTTILFVPLLAWTGAVLLRSLRRRRSHEAVYAIALSLPASYVFGTVGFVLVYWIFVGLVVVAHVFIERSRVATGDAIKALAWALPSWILLHAWWLVPLLAGGGEALGATTTLRGNLDTLEAISRQNTAIDILRGANTYYLYDTQTWGSVYQSPLFLAISFLMPCLAIIGILRARGSPLSIAGGILSGFGLFITKGSNPPFGDFLPWAIERLPALGVFRNPYERFVPILILGYALLVGQALGPRTNPRVSLRRNLSIAATVVCVIALSGVYVWPMWTGEVFGGKSADTEVKSTSDYTALELWLKSNGEQGRLYHLPSLRGEGVTYAWPKGYSGIDPMVTLLHESSIAGTLGREPADRTILAADDIFFSNASFHDYLATLGVRYVVLHHDTRPAERLQVDPSLYAARLTPGVTSADTGPCTERATPEQVGAQPGIELCRRFGRLDVYRVTGDIVPPVSSPTALRAAANVTSAFRPPRNVTGGEAFVLPGEGPTADALPAATIVRAEAPYPGFYRVTLQGARAGTVVVVSQQYSSFWRVYEGSPSVLALPWTKQAPSEHFVADGFANAWRLEGDATTLTFVYYPESIVQWARIVSGVGVVLVVGAVAFAEWRWRRWTS